MTDNRSCVGKHFARAILFLNMAQTLSVFNIRPRKDEHGRTVPPPVEFIGGHIRYGNSVSCASVDVLTGTLFAPQAAVRL